MNEIKQIGKITPYPYQHEVINNTLDHIRKQLKREIPNSPAFIDAYVSAGKTIIAGAIAHHCQNVGAKLLILARTGELVEQNSDECWNMDTQNSVFSASLGKSSTHYNIVVGTEGTVANHLDRKFSKFIPHIILIDECHEVNWNDVLQEGESCYSKIINHFKAMNPNVVIVGMTGSPYRGVESIRGPFWQTPILPKIDRKFLVENNYIQPTVFGGGHDDIQYDLSEFDKVEEFGTKDFSSKDMDAMSKKMNLSTTEKIMQEVIFIMKGRLCALVTCAGLKHCKEAASMVPEDESAIITDKTAKKLRRQILNDAKSGLLNERGTFRYKYIFQIGCLTTGINLPLWCTSVLLRRIGSLTLLTQLLGRGMRLLKDEHKAAGYAKHDHLCLDYSGTMAAMHQLFDDPILEDAQLQKDKANNDEMPCPECKTMNGIHARRCNGPDLTGSEPDGRCGFFFQYNTCEDQKKGIVTVEKGCGTKNDIAARECRGCGITLIDPNEKLNGTSYGLDDWKPVLLMEINVIGNNQDAIQVKYHLDSWSDEGEQEIATVNFWAIKAGGKRTWTSNFVRRHINGYPYQQKILAMSAPQVVGCKAMFDTPKEITHRINEKGNSVVHGLRFNSGKELKGNKQS